METEKMISIMQAFSEGKQIEFCEKGKDEWSVVLAPSWNWRDFDYRIKPEPKFRPYTFEELQAEIAKGKIVVKQVNLKGINRILTITQVMDDYDKASKIQLSDLKQISYERFMNDYQWLDGSLCGVLIKQ